MVAEGVRSPEQAALSKEMFSYLDDPQVRDQLEQCGQQQGSIDFNFFDWIITPAYAQTGCLISLPNGQTKLFTATQAVDCLSDYEQMTGIVRGIIGTTGVAVAALAGAFLLVSAGSTGQDINQKFTAADGSTVQVSGQSEQPGRLVLVTYPDGTRASLTIEVYDDGGAIYLTGGTIGNQPMTAYMLQDMQITLSNAGMSNIVFNQNSDGGGDQKYFPPPKTAEGIPGIPDLQKGKPVGGRARWYDSKGNIYEWDYQHGKIEKFDKSGKKHLGEYDPVTGAQTKPPKPGRTTPKG
ncbi:colicin E3/pyocin S6 family cytotoxin [Rhizobium leguminosarum]|uniref:colicin E3/pyocin S6 family cytotoxin n=1 Tax=Rhizobium leguminosarum TaxID=384 RepID=UPI00399AD1CC